MVQLTLVASPEVNPNVEGQPSPIQVQLYQLKTLAAFNSADFFQIADNPMATLGPSLIAQERFVLSPGERLVYNRELPPDARFVGVVASYRDLDNAIWRGSLGVNPHETTPAEGTLGTKALVLQLKPPAP